MKKYLITFILGTLLVTTRSVVCYAEAPLGWRGNSFYKTDENRYEPAKSKEEIEAEKIAENNRKKSLTDILRNLVLEAANSNSILDISGKVESSTNNSTFGGGGTGKPGDSINGGDGVFYSGSSPLMTFTGDRENFNQATFIELIAPIAMELGPKYSVFPSVLIANAAQESSWGNSSLVRDSNNIGGVKAYRDWTGPHSTSTSPSGEDGAYYRAYESINASMEDKAMVLQNSRYDRIREAKTPEDALLFHATGYAGDSSKDSQLLSMITYSATNLKQYDVEYNSLLSSGKINHKGKTREDIIANKYFN